MNIYIDVRNSFAVSKITGKFNGGNNYTIRIIKQLLQSIDDEHAVYLIAGKGINEQLYDIFGREKIYKIINVFSLFNFMPKLPAVYFNPQNKDEMGYVKEIEHMKKKYPGLKIIVTIHDRRHHEDWFDRYGSVLKSGIKKNWLVLGMGRLVNSFQKDRAIKCAMYVADKVFTVSNYSMQELLKVTSPRDITFYTQGVMFEGYDTEYAQNGNYILFVSAGRTEKNFIRALKAFEEYIDVYGNSDVKLIATGLSKEQQKIIKDKKLVQREVLEKQVIFTDYLHEADFIKLYRECRFLLFTSKSEGYGLPVAEALYFEKPVVASWKSSIPEVLGGAGLYVNPYSVDSIMGGIAQMMDDKAHKRQKEYIKKKKKIWVKQVELDTEMMINEILGNV